MSLPNEAINLLMSSSSNDYLISNSARFNGSNGYLSKTPASAGSLTTWTWSCWVKRSSFVEHFLFSSNGGQSLGGFDSSDSLRFRFTTGLDLITTAKYRDPSAWYHVIIVADTTNAIASNRTRIYVNGVRITSFSSEIQPSQSATGFWNDTNSLKIGVYGAPSGFYFSGYMAHVHFVDGQALTPTSFGEFNSITGEWNPIRYAGTYGTNGFKLDFANSADIGNDVSGNNNDWTVNNIASTDVVIDTPTNNFATFNPTHAYNVTLESGGLAFNSSTSKRSAGCTQWLATGKWYWEVTIDGSRDIFLGITNLQSCVNNMESLTGTWWIWGWDGTKWPGNSAYASAFVAGDVIQFAYNADTSKLWIGQNGSWLVSGNPTAGTNETWGSITGPITPILQPANSGSNTIPKLNCGQGGQSGLTYDADSGGRFKYTPPSGFKALCTQNLPTPAIKKPSQYMNIVTYTGNGATRSITGVGFQPDLVWTKSRSNAETYKLVDSVRGATKALSSDTTGDEVTESGLTSFDSDGFTINGTTDTGYNTNTYTYVGWSWKKGVTPGFDIVTYTGNGSARTISHALGAVPHFMIVKARTTAGTDQGWPVYHRNNTSASYYQLLNSTAAEASDTTVWNNTAPTSSVFSVGTNALTNTNNDTYVAYLFTEVAGFSKFGTYTGNGSADGPFVWCGFRPKLVMMKYRGSTGDWWIYDSIRSAFNASTNKLLTNSNAFEDNSGEDVDILSNGFKLKNTNAGLNTSSGVYIFAAFAETPFKYSRGR
jgi:hypothetical protein